MDSQSAQRAQAEDVSEELELCVLCNQPTNYKISDHIDKRRDYIEGMGQVCSKCSYTHRQYKNNDVTDALFDI